ncbi:MAG: [Fe-Fe] hydrogenase large subunit C-terminal domain-containing protein [Caldicoprobacterales bacterium]|jgi:iron only hydrogenase large subunit-like protein
MGEYYHSVTLNKSKCMGCTNCIKGCPTEAIRVRDGKARIIDERCIDCGECIRACPYHAKIAVTDPLSILDRYQYKIALPAPTLFGQFKKLKNCDKVLAALKRLGFDYVFEVAKGADVVTQLIKEKLAVPDIKKPLISSACPATVRLIQVRFPNLLDHLIRIESPMEIAAQMAKDEASRRLNIPLQEIGAFFITPCAAKMTSIRNPIGNEVSHVDGAISILDVYGPIASYLKIPDNTEKLQQATGAGLSWAVTGGEGQSLGIDNYLSVDGIRNVIPVLEEIENNKMTDLDFFEGLSCAGGCVGGPLTFENGYVAKNRIRLLAKGIRNKPPADSDIEYIKEHIQWQLQKNIIEKPVMKLDHDIVAAIQKMETMERINKNLPGLDCGSCGSPSCRTLAEDIVRGNASEMDCVFKLREKVKALAEEMIELSDKIPSGREGDKHT